MKRYDVTLNCKKCAVVVYGAGEGDASLADIVTGEPVCVIRPADNPADFEIECFMADGTPYTEPFFGVCVSAFFLHIFCGLPFGCVELTFFGKPVNYEIFDTPLGAKGIKLSECKELLSKKAKMSDGIELELHTFLCDVVLRAVRCRVPDAFDRELLPRLRIVQGHRNAREVLALTETPPYELVLTEGAPLSYAHLACASLMIGTGGYSTVVHGGVEYRTYTTDSRKVYLLIEGCVSCENR